MRERDAPRRWVIEGVVEGGGGGTVAYAVTPEGRGTRFDRAFVYAMRTLAMRVLDVLVLRRRVAGESAEALLGQAAP